MADCYRIPYSDRFGQHLAFKWGETPREALSAVKSRHPDADLGEPTLEWPLPFSDESRAKRAAFWVSQEEDHAMAPASSVAVEITQVVDTDTELLAVESDVVP